VGCDPQAIRGVEAVPRPSSGGAAGRGSTPSAQAASISLVAEKSNSVLGFWRLPSKTVRGRQQAGRFPPHLRGRHRRWPRPSWEIGGGPPGGLPLPPCLQAEALGRPDLACRRPCKGKCLAARPWAGRGHRGQAAATARAQTGRRSRKQRRADEKSSAGSEADPCCALAERQAVS